MKLLGLLTNNLPSIFDFSFRWRSNRRKTPKIGSILAPKMAKCGICRYRAPASRLVSIFEAFGPSDEQSTFDFRFQFQTTKQSSKNTKNRLHFWAKCENFVFCRYRVPVACLVSIYEAFRTPDEQSTSKFPLQFQTAKQSQKNAKIVSFCAQNVTKCSKTVFCMLLPSQRWCGRTHTIGKSSLDLEFPTKHETLVSTTKRSFLFGKTAVNPTWRKLPLYPWALPQLQSGTFQHTSVWPEHFCPCKRQQVTIRLLVANPVATGENSQATCLQSRECRDRILGFLLRDFWLLRPNPGDCPRSLMQLTLPSQRHHGRRCPVLANVWVGSDSLRKMISIVPEQILCIH